MKSLRNSLYALGVVGLSLLPLKSEAGTLTGRVTDMFSNTPYNGALVTLVNETTGEVFKDTTGITNPTAVEPTSWGLIKRNLIMSKKPVFEPTLEGGYALDLPDGDYTVAVTDQEIPAAKFTSGDLFALQYNPEGNLFVPRVFRLRVNGKTYHDEAVVPRGTDLEFLWIVLSGKLVRYDYDNTTFYVDIGPARNNFRPDPNGKLPKTEEIDIAVNGIKEFVRLDTQGKVAPRIEVGTNAPEFIPNPKGGNMVPPGYALFIWDSGLKLPQLGGGAPWTDGEGNKITSSYVRVAPGVAVTFPGIVKQEIIGAGGLHGEPGTNYDLDRRIRDTGGSIFLDIMTGDVNVDEPTQRDEQIIGYHGARPIGTRAPDLTEKIVNE